MKPSRLDQLLVARQLLPSRARARDAVKRGAVKVDGKLASKAGLMVADDAVIEVADAAAGYVSRAALKLKTALALWPLDLSGRYGVDVGAAQGGFTQVLLEHGVAKVTAIEVGHGQMLPPLADDPRIELIENLNARHVTAQHISSPPDLIVCDVSFISLKLALPPILGLAAGGADLLALIKPQFEAGRKAIGKGGIVSDETVHKKVCDDIAYWLGKEQGYEVLGLVPSAVRGSDGNQEFIIHGRKIC